MSLQATAGRSRKDSDLSHIPETLKSEPARLCLERGGERERGRKKKNKGKENRKMKEKRKEKKVESQQMLVRI